MNWKRIVAVAAGLALLALVVFKLKSNKETSANSVYQYDNAQPINVQVDTIARASINAEDSFTGTFEPNKESKISAEIQGKINAVLVDVGSVVIKGQTLIQLDNALLKLQLQTVDVQIEGLQADVSRFTILTKADAIQGVQLEKAQLGLKTAKIQRATLQEQINKTTIKAPFGGIITAKFSEEGAFAAPGIPLLQITDIRQLKFSANVSEIELSKFKLNQTYTLIADAFPEIKLSGIATLIGSKANMGSSFPVQFTVNNTPDLTIKSGMFGKVFIGNEKSEKSIIIPSSAIQGTASQPQVYVVLNGKAVIVDIEISYRIGNKAIISKGLKDGDLLITNGFINLFKNANVTIQ